MTDTKPRSGDMPTTAPDPFDEIDDCIIAFANEGLNGYAQDLQRARSRLYSEIIKLRAQSSEMGNPITEQNQSVAHTHPPKDAGPVAITDEDVDRAIAAYEANGTLCYFGDSPSRMRKALESFAASHPSDTSADRRDAELCRAIAPIMPDVIGILSLLRCAAMFGEFGGTNYDGVPMHDALASAIGTLTELDMICEEQAIARDAQNARSDK